MSTNQSYRPDPDFRGTPRQTTASYINAVFGIMMYGFLSFVSWEKGASYIGGFLATILFVSFGFLSFVQVIGLVLECMGINDHKNPVTHEWATIPTGGDPKKLRYIRTD